MPASKSKNVIVEGGRQLYGEIKIQGSKNSVLPMMAAALLNRGITILNNCPVIADVENMTLLLQLAGCQIKREKDTLIIDSSSIQNTDFLTDIVKETRASILLIGALLANYNEVKMTYPGGCKIGGRPIDIHLDAIERLGGTVAVAEGYVSCKADRLTGCNINLRFSSVGATENVLLLAVLAEGVTIIDNAACEPEIAELADLLNEMGADIKGAGSRRIVVNGVRELRDVRYTVKADRIVAGTYLAAAACAGGDVVIKKVDPFCMSSAVTVFARAGCDITQYNDSIEINTKVVNKKAVSYIVTEVYPGFPTDMQPQIMSVLATAHGNSCICESIFESRFKTAYELNKMGASIEIKQDENMKGQVAIIKGVKRLRASKVTAHDLRGGAALICAALGADGITTVDNYEYIQRGYEDIIRDLKVLGANIKLNR